MADDLTRWSETSEAPAELQTLLKSAQQDLPSKAQLSGLEASLGSLLQPAAPPAAPTATGGMGSGLPAAAKIAVLVAVGGLVGTAAWFSSGGDVEPPSTPSPGSEPSHTLAAPQPTRAKSALEVSKAPPPEPAASEPRPEAAAQPSVQPKPTPPKASAKPSEASLLSQAQQALKSDPARALAITRQHKRLYPKGALSQEREVIAIEALARLNKKGSAQEKAEAFKERYPESAHQKKVYALEK